MNQQINLYQPIFRKEKIVFSAQTIAWLALGLIVLLALWALLVGQRIAGLEAELERQLQAEQRAVNQVTQIQSNMPSDEPDAALLARVERLRERRQGLRESLVALQQRMPATELDLRRRLDALARRVPEGVWLTGITMAEQGQALAVSGNALEARLIPAWLEELSASEEFSGMGFRQVHIGERAADQPGVEFTISTAAREEQ